jgi:DNA-binding winged helix-turn-helix (wHTH) protein
MQLPLVRTKPRREPMVHDGSPIVEDRASPGATDAALVFGRFRVLLRQRRLLAGGVPVELGARAFDLLMVLLEADGLLVTKNELLALVWPGIFVDETNLKVQIFALRKALGEDRDFIQTEIGRGYRFTGATISVAAAPENQQPMRRPGRGACRKRISRPNPHNWRACRLTGLRH